MDPFVTKLLIMFIMIVSFTICIFLFFLFYKNVVKPWRIRLFQYKKVLVTAQVMLLSGEPDDKVKNLIAEGILDRNLILATEKEMKKAKASADILWREKDGKENRVHETTGRTDKREIGEAEKGTGSGSGTGGGEPSGEPGPRENTSNDKGASERRVVPDEPTGVNEKQHKYFT